MDVTVRDLLDLYALKNRKTDLDAMLQDYELDSRLSRTNLNTRIIFQLGERKSYYSDSTLLKYAIENFFQINAWNITKLVDTMFAEFDPIQDTNYYEDEEKDIELHRTDTEDETVDDTATTDTTEKRKQVVDDDKTKKENTETTTDETSEEQVSAYNVSSYQPRSKNIAHSDMESTSNTTETDDKTTTEDNTENEKFVDKKVRDWDGTRHDKTDDDRNLHVYGLKNGHTYQELIKAERENAEFNIYDYIIRKLKREICLMIW